MPISLFTEVGIFAWKGVSIMPMIDMTATGENIKNLIAENGMKVKDVAKVFGFASAYPVYKWINGTTLPALENLVVLAKTLNVTMDEIIIVTTA